MNKEESIKIIYKINKVFIIRFEPNNNNFAINDKSFIRNLLYNHLVYLAA